MRIWYLLTQFETTLFAQLPVIYYRLLPVSSIIFLAFFLSSIFRCLPIYQIKKAKTTVCVGITPNVSLFTYIQVKNITCIRYVNFRRRTCILPPDFFGRASLMWLKHRFRKFSLLRIPNIYDNDVSQTQSP